MDSGQDGIMRTLEDKNVDNNNNNNTVKDTSVHGSGTVPPQLVEQGPAFAMADGANTIHDMDTNATNETMIQLLNKVIDFLESLAGKLEIAQRGSSTAGLHNLDNPHADGEKLFWVEEVLNKNDWMLRDRVNWIRKGGVDFRSRLLDDPMLHSHSLDVLVEDLAIGKVIDTEAIGNYREFLLVLAGDLLDI